MSERRHLSGGVHGLLWFHANDPRSVHLTINDDRLVYPGSGKMPGLHLAFTDKPLSANYNPVALIRCLHALRSDGVSEALDPSKVFVAPRHIARRDEVIEQWKREKEPKKTIVAKFPGIPESRLQEAHEAIDRLKAIIAGEDDPREGFNEA